MAPLGSFPSIPIITGIVGVEFSLPILDSNSLPFFNNMIYIRIGDNISVTSMNCELEIPPAFSDRVKRKGLGLWGYFV